MVVDALAGPILNMDLSHITGEAIVRGDTVAIRYDNGDAVAFLALCSSPCVSHVVGVSTVYVLGNGR